MPAWIELTDLRTGQTRLVFDEDFYSVPEEEESNLFAWQENNYSCDCNRAGLFYPERDADDLPCGDERFWASFAYVSDGRVVEIDGPRDELEENPYVYPSKGRPGQHAARAMLQTISRFKSIGWGLKDLIDTAARSWESTPEARALAPEIAIDSPGDGVASPERSAELGDCHD